MYRNVIAMNVRAGEFVFGCPRDRQVKEVVTGVDVESADLLRTELFYVDNSYDVLPAMTAVQVAGPAMKRPELTLISQTRDPGWSRYHRAARQYRDTLAQDAASWSIPKRSGDGLD